MEKRLEQIEELLRASGAFTTAQMIDALGDGELLARLGITDTGAMLDQLGVADTIENREAVEDLHARYIENRDAVEELHARYTAAVREEKAR